MYKITIEKIEVEEYEKSGGYVQLGLEYASEAEVRAMDANESKEYKMVDAPGGTIQYEKKIFGYLPNQFFKRDIVTKLFEQSIETIKLSDIIKSINGM